MTGPMRCHSSSSSSPTTSPRCGYLRAGLLLLAAAGAAAHAGAHRHAAEARPAGRRLLRRAAEPATGDAVAAGEPFSRWPSCCRRRPARRGGEVPACVRRGAACGARALAGAGPPARLAAPPPPTAAAAAADAAAADAAAAGRRRRPPAAARLVSSPRRRSRHLGDDRIAVLVEVHPVGVLDAVGSVSVSVKTPFSPCSGLIVSPRSRPRLTDPSLLWWMSCLGSMRARAREVGRRARCPRPSVDRQTGGRVDRPALRQCLAGRGVLGPAGRQRHPGGDPGRARRQSGRAGRTAGRIAAGQAGRCRCALRGRQPGRRRSARCPGCAARRARRHHRRDAATAGTPPPTDGTPPPTDATAATAAATAGPGAAARTRGTGRRGRRCAESIPAKGSAMFCSCLVNSAKPCWISCGSWC